MDHYVDLRGLSFCLCGTAMIAQVTAESRAWYFDSLLRWGDKDTFIS